MRAKTFITTAAAILGLALTGCASAEISMTCAELEKTL